MSDMVVSMCADGDTWHNKENGEHKIRTAQEALNDAGINWSVVQEPITVRGNVVPGYLAVVKNDDGQVLGVNSEIYAPVQNVEAFSFVDALIGSNEAHYNTAGCLFNKYERPTRIWISAELKPVTLMGDQIRNYLVFSHSHDGKNAIKVFVTPVRVVCNNTLTLAIDSVKRFWSTKHVGDMKHKLEQAKTTLKLYNDYIAALPAEAEKINAINLYDEEIASILDQLFPSDNDNSRQSKNALTIREDVLSCYNNKQDIQRFNGTAWGFYQAVTDVIEHRSPFRQTKTADINRQFSVIEGHPVIVKAQELLAQIKK